MKRLMKILPLLILALAVIIRVLDPAPVEQLRLAAFDQLQKLQPRPYTALPVRIVDIDELVIQPKLLGEVACHSLYPIAFRSMMPC